MKRPQEDNVDNSISKSRKHNNTNADRETKSLEVNHRKLSSLQFPYFRQPQEVGSFSLDEERDFHCDNSQLRWFVNPPNPHKVRFDLRHGYKDFIKKDETKKGYIDDMLKWILMNKSKFSLSSDVSSDNRISGLNTDFVCWRGLLTKILCTPYENRDDWIIAVTLFHGTYYLCEIKTEEKMKQEAEMPEKQQEMSYWGFKFEQYTTAASPNEKPKLDVPVNTNIQYCTVMRSRLDKHSIVYSGEVDCVDPSESKKSCKYVELKTNRNLEHYRAEQNFKRFKLLKWWAQSFLVGIPKIVCGFRDDDGMVNRVQYYETMTIPDIAQEDFKYPPWLPSVCFNFLDNFLTFLKATIKIDDCHCAHLLRWKPQHSPDTVTCENVGVDLEHQFLPEWYIKEFKHKAE